MYSKYSTPTAASEDNTESANPTSAVLPGLKSPQATLKRSCERSTSSPAQATKNTKDKTVIMKVTDGFSRTMWSTKPCNFPWSWQNKLILTYWSVWSRFAANKGSSG